MLCKLMPKQDKASPFAPHAVARSHRRSLSLDQEAAKPARQSAATASAHPHSEATRQCGPDTAKMATGRQRQEARLPRSRLGDLQPAQDNSASSQQQYSKGNNTTNQNAQQASGTPVSSHPLTEGASILRDAPQRLKDFFLHCLFAYLGDLRKSLGATSSWTMLYLPCARAGWWVDDAQEEAEGAGLTLPQPLWEALERLQCVEDGTGLSGRLQYGAQLANTSSGGVYTAVLDGLQDVAVKVQELPFPCYVVGIAVLMVISRSCDVAASHIPSVISSSPPIRALMSAQRQPAPSPVYWPRYRA